MMENNYIVEAYEGVRAICPHLIEDFSSYPIAYEFAATEAYHRDTEVYIWIGDTVADYFGPGQKDCCDALDIQNTLALAFETFRRAQNALPL
jgi:hypothetical protein